MGVAHRTEARSRHANALCRRAKRFCRSGVVRRAEPRFVITGVVSQAQLKEQVAQLEKARHGQIKCLADQALFAERGRPTSPALSECLSDSGERASNEINSGN